MPDGTIPNPPSEPTPEWRDNSVRQIQRDLAENNRKHEQVKKEAFDRAQANAGLVVPYNPNKS
jgi:hypothetical protein